MRLERPFVLILLVVFLKQIAIGQQVKINLGKSPIFINEEYKITLILPKELKKEYQSFSYSAFPEFDGFIKLKTEYSEDRDSKTYRIIQSYIPQKIGKNEIYAFKLKVGNEIISSSGMNVFVKNSTKKSNYHIPDNLEFKEEEQNLKFIVDTDKREAYVGEGFVLNAGFLIGISNKVKIHFKDLHRQTADIAQKLSIASCAADENTSGIIPNPTFDSIRLGNQSYKFLKLFEARYFPINGEKIELPVLQFSITRYKTGKVSNTIWWKAEDVVLNAPPVKILVKELPDHPLKDAVPVGNFQLKEAISRTRVSTGTALHYKAIIRGNGNLTQILSPSIEENTVLEIFTPNVKQRIIREKNNYGGKIFEYSILPKEPGNYPLSDYFQWIYFNPEKKRYDTLHSQISVHVHGESIKNKEIGNSYLGSFYELAGKESNKLRSKETDESTKYFANIIILFMLVSTAILVFKR